MSTEVADPLEAQRFAAGSILAGKTITIRFVVTADPEGGSIADATAVVYTTDETTGIAVPVDTAAPEVVGDTMTIIATITFPDDIATRREIVVTLDVDQDGVDLDAVEYAYDVIPRVALPPTDAS